MQIIKQIFTDYNIYSQTVIGWNLDYNILSQKDFRADLNMYIDESFGLSRIQLKGKLVHSGVAPIGYRSFVIPIEYEQKFIWFNKGSGGNELLIFPRNCELSAVTFNNFDVFVFSIENKLLQDKIKELDCFKCKSSFTENENTLILSKEFAREFYVLANNFLTNHIKTEDISQVDIEQNTNLKNQIIDKLIDYIDFTKSTKTKVNKTRKEIALVDAVNIINNNSETLFSVKELSSLTNVSERTLLYAFKEKFNITPCEYIKVFRLNKVKNELFALKNQNVKISTVAGKYQFWHMGQFAKDFKKHFGYLPSKYS